MEGASRNNNRVDLLHPLASLLWEHCNDIRLSSVNYCAVNGDQVVVLTRKITSCDVIYVSSDNLDSWDAVTLPYQSMSLTTHKSKFVLVGGCDLRTKIPSTSVITSETGLDWRPSLPPLPLNLFSSSAVGVSSPEALVVIGVKDFSSLNGVVSVLLEDSWHMGHPLPIPFWNVQFTCHNDRLYLMGGANMGPTIYSCTIASLISSCEDSSSTTDSDTPVWQEDRLDFSLGTAVSFLSRLVFIDKEGLIRTRCSEDFSFLVEIASDKDKLRGSSSYVSATVLPSEDILCIHKRNMYKVKLSVSSFYPENCFVSDVFSRLEAVMEIPIVSIVANKCSQLLTSSGVNLQCQKGEQNIDQYPEQYVKRTMARWHEKRSHRPSTWSQLLLVLQEIGLKQLSQQIEVFMKGVKNHILGYLVEDNASFMRDKNIQDFKLNQIELHFQKRLASKITNDYITVREGSCGAFKYPPMVEAVSKIYDIDCSNELSGDETVTIKIYHNSHPNHITQLSFITSSESVPPYNFTILEGGLFNSEYGTIEVDHFSKYAIGLFKKHHFKGLLAMFERSYVALLHSSVKFERATTKSYWSTYVSVVKDCSIFKTAIKEDVSKEYSEEVRLECQCKVTFEEGKSEIEIISEQSNDGGVAIKPLTHPSICKTEIDKYFESSPPLVKYKLSIDCQSDTSDVDIVFTLQNMRKPKNVLKLVKCLPDISKRSLPDLEEASSTNTVTNMAPLNAVAPTDFPVPVFTRLFSKLVADLSSNVKTISDQCLSVGLISMETYEEIHQKDLTGSDRSRILLSAVGRSISRDVNFIHLFTSVLEDAGGYDNFVDQLRHSE